jgi:uncharacterized protein YlzI (FlbEa/FlbD family)
MFIKLTQVMRTNPQELELILNALNIKDIQKLPNETCMLETMDHKILIVKETFEELNEKLGVK